MITETKEIYKCEHCRKLYQIKRFAEAHEKSCTKNPDNFRACLTCTHPIKKDVTFSYDTFQGEDERTVRILYCPVKEMYIHPPSVEHKGTAFELGDYLNEPMPKVCDRMIDYTDPKNW